MYYVTGPASGAQKNTAEVCLSLKRELWEEEAGARGRSKCQGEASARNSFFEEEKTAIEGFRTSDIANAQADGKMGG
jgi:hypothetical protein